MEDFIHHDVDSLYMNAQLKGRSLAWSALDPPPQSSQYRAYHIAANVLKVSSIRDDGHPVRLGSLAFPPNEPSS
jgi:hypothetical protein